ncbi:hypothetical protein ACLOJK_008823 [Asimina triloba]
MRCVNLIRSLVLGDNIHDPLLLYQRRRHPHHHHEEEESNDDESVDDDGRSCLFFLPTHETIHDTRKLAAIARDMGMNFTPDPSLTYILFSWPDPPPPPPPSSSSSLSTSPPHTSGSMAIPLPFPSLSSASASHLRRFAGISNGLFTLVTCNTCACTAAADDHDPHDHPREAAAAVSGGLFSRLSGEKIQDMEALARALTGNGWALFKTTTTTPDGDGRRYGAGDSFVFRKVERDGMMKTRWRSGWKVEAEEEEEEYCRVREVRLPWLDFGHHVVPTRILHYILLMTDDLFYLA